MDPCTIEGTRPNTEHTRTKKWTEGFSEARGYETAIKQSGLLLFWAKICLLRNSFQLAQGAPS